MKLFALGDPHLSFDAEGNEYKPMGIFGSFFLVTAGRTTAKRFVSTGWIVLQRKM